MSELLVEGGFRLCANRAWGEGGRADCAHCTGRSRGTVSYNAEVAHCFRCGWKANRRQLERKSGRRERRTLQKRKQDALRVFRASEIRAFERWREERLRQVSDRYYALSQAAVRAERLLAEVAQASACGIGCEHGRVGGNQPPQAEACATEVPACQLTPEVQDLCLDALARFYHEEARLSAAFDFLMCARASAWLEDDARIEDVFQFWKQEAGRKRFG